MAIPSSSIRSVVRAAGKLLLVAVALPGLLSAGSARAAESQQDRPLAPLSDYLANDTVWDEPPIAVDRPANDAAAMNSETAPSESPLADRVDALERYIREQEETKQPPASSPHTIVKPTFTPTGRFYFDGAVYDDDDATAEFFDTDRDNEFGFRTFRIGGKGNIWENLVYNLEFELRGGPNSITYKDIYMEQQNIPLIGHFRAGHFKEPLGLEELASDLFLTFMEKTPATQAFTPSRNFGVMMWDTTDPCQDITWFAGLFRADSPDGPASSGLWRSDNNDWSFDTRLAWLPYYDEPSQGRYLVHLGGSYSFRHIGGLTTGAAANQNVAYSTLNGLAEFTKRSWVGSQGPLGFGAEADSDEWNQLNAEFLVIWGAGSVQSEYFQVLMNGGENYQGGYTFLSYFLTGENRAYRKETKIIDRTIPYESFFWVDTCNGAACGWGAWEIAAGYSWVNLEDGHDIVATVPANSTNRRRGFNNDVVIGVNWYHNPWSRVTIDYEHEIVDFVDGGVPDSNANIFGMRWQIDW